MKNKKNVKNFKKEYVFISIIVLSILNIMDSYQFLKGINYGNVSIQDIVIYSIYGLNENSRTSLTDVVRSSIPYLLVFLVNSIYFSSFLEGSNKYLYIIRYKYLKSWLKENIKKLIKLIIMLLSAYYVILVIVASIFIRNREGFTEAFYILNPYYTGDNNVMKLIVCQYVLTLSALILLTLIQLMLSMLINDVHRVFIYMNFFIIMLVTTGVKGIYNPIMLSKHRIINYTIDVGVVTTIATEIIISIFIYIYIMKIVKLVVRSDTR